MATYQAIAEGVYQLSLPLPFALRQVNCYLLQGETGWNIIDTGLNIPEARQVWLDTFAALGIGSGDIERIEPDPLASYLASLERLQELDVRLGLPGHRAVISDWSGRLTELATHHAERLAAMLAAVNGSGTNLYQICTAVFAVEKFGEHQIRFALAETLAHVEYLVGQNQLTRDEAWCYYRV